LLMFGALGALITVAAWTASATFAEVVQKHDPPPLAYVVRYAIVAVGAAVPVITLLITWWWLGRSRDE